jgi:hypothetical protein
VTASGIQVVPDPILSMLMPTGPIIMSSAEWGFMTGIGILPESARVPELLMPCISCILGVAGICAAFAESVGRSPTLGIGIVIGAGSVEVLFFAPAPEAADLPSAFEAFFRAADFLVLDVVFLAFAVVAADFFGAGFLPIGMVMGIRTGLFFPVVSCAGVWADRDAAMNANERAMIKPGRLVTHSDNESIFHPK